VKVVFDTNVILSGVFFGGLPGHVLEAWRDGRFTLHRGPGAMNRSMRGAIEYMTNNADTAQKIVSCAFRWPVDFHTP
jgi:predicted nucleic acid-binding protein